MSLRHFFQVLLNGGVVVELMTHCCSRSLFKPVFSSRWNSAQSSGDVRPSRSEVPEARGTASTTLCVYDPWWLVFCSKILRLLVGYAVLSLCPIMGLLGSGLKRFGNSYSSCGFLSFSGFSELTFHAQLYWSHDAFTVWSECLLCLIYHVSLALIHSQLTQVI